MNTKYLSNIHPLGKSYSLVRFETPSSIDVLCIKRRCSSTASDVVYSTTGTTCSRLPISHPAYFLLASSAGLPNIYLAITGLYFLIYLLNAAYFC